MPINYNYKDFSCESTYWPKNSAEIFFQLKYKDKLILMTFQSCKIETVRGYEDERYEEKRTQSQNFTDTLTLFTKK